MLVYVCIAIPKRVLYAIKIILINPVFYIQRCSIFSKISFAVKITDVNSDVCKIHSDFRNGIICTGD